ncbi:ubiquilin-like isoform X2 [Atheta coriaria]|uniref:ubiquilin-like isoform X2 n=1 Tax=Dalotia coriaria TaxID=877792 RepID=UPI0031F4576B
MGKQPECVQGDLIYVVVRNNEHIEEIAVRLSQRIGELKTLVARRFNVNMRQLCLIYAGRVLADTENLFDCNMTHGCTVHLVIRDDQVDTCRFKNCVLQSIAASSTDNTRLEEEDTTDEADPVAHLLSNDKFLGTLRKLHPEFQNVVLNPDVVNIIRHPNMLQEYLKAFTDDFEDTSDDDQDADLENTMTGNFETLPRLQYPHSQEESCTFPSLVNRTNPNIYQFENNNNNPYSNPWATEGTQQFGTTHGINQVLNSSNPLSSIEDGASDSNNLQTFVESTPNLSSTNLGHYLSSIFENLETMDSASGLRDYMAQMAQQRPPPPIQPPQVRYRNQLDQLQRMGYTDPDANLRALCRTFGDLNGAVRILAREE